MLRQFFPRRLRFIQQCHLRCFSSEEEPPSDSSSTRVDGTWYGFDGDFEELNEDGEEKWRIALRKAVEPENAKKKSAGDDDDENARNKILREPEIDELGRSYATGRRKTSTARVWVSQGEDCSFSVNGKHMADYFKVQYMKEDLLGPFMVTNQLGKFHVHCTVKGGGIAGQAGAIRHGMSRALEKFNPELRPELKKAGYLTRDPRMVERKKPGQPKARKKFQWVKR